MGTLSDKTLHALVHGAALDFQQSRQSAAVLFPQKQNDGARVRPVGLEFAFGTEQIGVRSVDLTTVEGLAERMPLATRISAALERGPMTIVAIAEELDAKADSLTKAVNRRKEFTKVSGSDGVTRIALVERRTA